MKDYIVRAAAKDGSVRAFCAVTTNLVNRAQKIHSLYPVASAALGRLLTASAMMGAMLKSEDDLLTVQITGNGPIGRVLATADCHSNVKGYVGNPKVVLPKNDKGKLDVGGAVGTDGFLTVIRDFGLKEPYVGKVPLVSGEIGDDLTSYFAVSEQIPSVVGLGVLVDVDLSVKAAGGFIVQVMPEATDETITRLEENVKKITSVTKMLEDNMLPEDILKCALDGIDFEITDKTDTKYYCNCSRDRVEKALVSLGKSELEDIIKKDKKAEIMCHFCDKVYNFDENDLKILLENAENNKKKNFKKIEKKY